MSEQENHKSRFAWMLMINRIVLGGVFAFAGAAKMQNPQAFADAVGGFRLLPEAVLLPAALYLLWLEVTCGVLLIAGIGVRAAGLLACGMTALFLFFILSARARGLDIQCGCFGALLKDGIGGWAFLRPLALLAPGVIALRGGGGRWIMVNRGD